SSLFAFGSTFFLHAVINYIERREDDHSLPLEPAYLYVTGILVSEVVRTVVMGQNLYYGRMVDVRIKAMLNAEVYAKSLKRWDSSGSINRVSEGEISEASQIHLGSDTGRITNVMAVDTSRIAALASYFFYIY